MYITFLRLKNWRNLRDVSFPFSQPSTYVIGPNAAGKSNLLDVFRFLRDICKPSGGGLQKAVADRGGITKLRCLHSRRDPEVEIEVHLASSIDSGSPEWRYKIGFKSEGKGAHRLLVAIEEVWHGETKVLSRADKNDDVDQQLLTETHLEQTRANAEFRAIADYLADITYLHLVPQLLKFGDKIGGNRLEDDPFGQGFLERIAKTPQRTRDARLRRINKALNAAVPQFKELRYRPDEMGRPHLEVLYEHFQPNAGWVREDQLSDGTLRLLGILWSLLDGNGLLLIEEPELSLNEAVIEQIPLLVSNIRRQSERRRQTLISTHSEAMLRNRSIDHRSVLVLEPSREGSRVRPVNESEQAGLEAGLSVADVVLPQTRPKGVAQLGLWD